ncbi:MAG TPA: carboxypeptidase-like regulatory domain-containing protein [Methylococcus sp.]|nr:carboxypeptidase-like regulatory domain-containing protein [Methylococcus sp.]
MDRQTMIPALLLMAALTLSPFGLVADDAPLRIHDEQGFRFVSGGVGGPERDYLDSIANQFDLQLRFATTEGAYLSDVRVVLQDASRRTVLDTVADGPFLYVDLPSGTYSVIVSSGGQEQQRRVNVTAGRLSRVDFYWRR